MSRPRRVLLGALAAPDARRRRVPRPLLAILAVVLVASLAWTFAVPALQGADESSHFAYIQKIADAHEIPWTQSNEGLVQPDFYVAVSSEQALAWTWAGLEPLRGNLADVPLWTKADERIWARENAKLPPTARQDGQGSQVFHNPPLYYLTAVVPYKLAGGSFFDRLFAVRLYNVLLLLATVALTWLLAGEVFGRRRELQTVAVAAVGLQPVLLDTMTRVTPDALLMTLSSAALYLMARLLRRGWSWRIVALLTLAVTAACFTQGRAIGLIPAALFAIGLALYRRFGGALPRASSRVLAGGLWVGGAALALVVGAIYATRFQFGQLAGFWSYLWQFYLPRLPGMSDPIGPHWSVGDVYLNRFFGTFVQFEVGFPQRVLDLLRLAIWVGIVLLAVAAWRHRRALAARRDVVAMLVVTFLVVVLSLHAAAFHALLQNPADPVITGRYLLMLIPLLGIGVAAALSALPGRLRAGVTGAVLAGGFLFQIAAFGLVMARFYA